MKMIFQKHIAKRKLPKNFQEKDKALFQHELEKEIVEAYLQDVSRVLVLGTTLFKPWSFSRFFGFYLARKESNFFFLKKLLMLVSGWKILSEGVWIADNRSVNYFHWFADALTRWLMYAGEGENLPILIPEEYYKIPFVQESLNALDCPFLVLKSNQAYLVKKLTLTSYTAKPGNYNHELINQLHQRLSIEIEEQPNRRIFISRLKAPKRKISNESEVALLMEEYGFEVHHFEDYDWQEQVQIMSQTRLLASLHGAGLTNMLFMPRSGKILELRKAGDLHNNCYFSMASELNHEYYYQQCESHSDQPEDLNVIVDLAELRANLELMIADL